MTQMSDLGRGQNTVMVVVKTHENGASVRGRAKLCGHPPLLKFCLGHRAISWDNKFNVLCNEGGKTEREGGNEEGEEE